MSGRQRSPDHDRLAALEHRLERLECERDVRGVIERFGFGVDAGDGVAAASTFTDDGRYDSDLGRCGSPAEIAALVDAPERARRRFRTAHLVGPLHVELADDLTSAVAVGYSMVVSRSDGPPSVDRLAINRWEVVRQDGRWRCASRTLRPVGDEAAAALLAPAIQPADVR